MAKINADHLLMGKNRRNLRVLVAPLDWGLGHATRCIPVIYELLRQNVEVTLAGEGAQQALLQQEFPKLSFLPLQGYRIRYGRSRTGLIRKLFFQVPKLMRSIKQEHLWLQQTMKEHAFDAIISDNRYGLYHPRAISVIITHQLSPKSPFGNWGGNFLGSKIRTLIDKFNQCWVPDKNGSWNLGGELSHPVQMPAIDVKYIGILSRFVKKNIDEKKNHLLISISGPEPQRTILEDKLVDDISHYNGTAVFVRGLPGSRSLLPSTNDIIFYNHLGSDEFNQEMQKAEYVISRSGYSTVMDIGKLGKKSILVPTPGQTEQEYLANHLEKIGFACMASQNSFSLTEALKKAEQFNFNPPPDPVDNTSQLQETITDFLSRLNSVEN